MASRYIIVASNREEGDGGDAAGEDNLGGGQRCLGGVGKCAVGVDCRLRVAGRPRFRGGGQAHLATVYEQQSQPAVYFRHLVGTTRSLDSARVDNFRTASNEGYSAF
jgi:hypothetical protein